MKKTRFLALALIVAVALMGAGYAYWAETITIENTINTGKFDLRFEKLSATDYHNVGGADYVYGPNGETGGNSYLVPSADGNTLHFELTNFYPGAGAQIKFKIVNDSTIPAKIESVMERNFTDTGLEGDLNFRLDKVEIKNNNGTISTIYNAGTTFTDVTLFVDELNTILTTHVTKLEPGHWIEVNGSEGYDVEMPIGSEIDNSTQQKSLSFDIEINAVQWNK